MTVTSFGRPSVSVPVLSTTSVVTFSRISSASALRISTPCSAPRPVPTMIDMGVARPRAHGQAMIKTATAFTSACASRGSGPTRDQTTNVITATTITIGNEPGGHGIGQPLDGCSRSLRLAHHPDDLREQRLAPDALRLHDELAGGVHRPARHCAAWSLLDGNRLTGDHRFVDGAFAFEHHAIDGNAFAWPHAKSVTDVHAVRAARRARRRPFQSCAPSSARVRGGS